MAKLLANFVARFAKLPKLVARLANLARLLGELGGKVGEFVARLARWIG